MYQKRDKERIQLCIIPQVPTLYIKEIEDGTDKVYFQIQ